MKKFSLVSGLVVSGIVVSSVFSSAKAAVVITTAEASGNVTFIISGSLNTTGLAFPNVRSDNAIQVDPSHGLYGYFLNTVYGSNITGPSLFGSGGLVNAGQINGNASHFGFSGSTGNLYLPSGYTSGTP